MLEDVERTHISAVQFKWESGIHILNFIYPYIYQ